MKGSVDLGNQVQGLNPSDGESYSHVTSFYQSLVLLSVLAPPRCFRESPPPTPWHRFLDNLSLICDTETGGKSVVSIAVEQRADTMVYWIANNGKAKAKAKASNHLRWVLELLRELHTIPTGEIASYEEELLRRTVDIVHKKIKNYGRRLEITLQKESSLEHTDDAEAKQLSDALQRILGSRHDPFRCCKLAYELRKSPHMSTLDRFVKTVSVHTDWSLVRHYVGRLGCFAKAVKFLVRVGWRCPELFNFDIRPLSAESASKSQHAVRHLKENLVPVATTEHTQNLRTSLAFNEKSSDPNFRPLVHAEVVLLEHFYANGLRFFKDDRYIGCSKASCFCCYLYGQLHPGKFELRPCHGNVWIKWSTSQLSEKDVVTKMIAKKVLELMTKEIQADIDQYLVLGPRKRASLLDSTTDLSASIPSTFSWV